MKIQTSFIKIKTASMKILYRNHSWRYRSLSVEYRNPSWRYRQHWKCGVRALIKICRVEPNFYFSRRGTNFVVRSVVNPFNRNQTIFSCRTTNTKVNGKKTNCLLHIYSILLFHLQFSMMFWFGAMEELLLSRLLWSKKLKLKTIRNKQYT
jgi:hypothetical protein